jgi:flagellar motor switch protein FliM
MTFYTKPANTVLAELTDQNAHEEKFALLFGEFSGRWRAGLASIHPAFGSLELQAVEVKPYSRYLQETAPHADIQIYQVEALQTICAWGLDSRLVPLAVDLMFGGHGRLVGLSSLRRDTEIECRVRSRMLDLLATAFESACQSKFPIRLAELRQEKQRSMLRLASPQELVLHASLSLVISELHLSFDFCIPSRTLSAFSPTGRSPEPVGRQAGEFSHARDESPWAQDMRLRLNKAPLEAVAVLVEKKMTVDELLSLSIGQVISLSIPQEIPLKIDSTTFLKGKYGVKNGRYALQVGQVMGSDQPTLDPELAQSEAVAEAPPDQENPSV